MLPIFLAESIQLIPDGSLLVHIALILFMIFVLNRTLFRPINQILARREQLLGRGKGSAADLVSQIDDKLARYEDGLNQARTAGYNQMEATRQEELRHRQALLDSVKKEVSEGIEQNKRELRGQMSVARQNLMTDAGRIAEQLKTRILR